MDFHAFHRCLQGEDRAVTLRGCSPIPSIVSIQGINPRIGVQRILVVPLVAPSDLKLAGSGGWDGLGRIGKGLVRRVEVPESKVRKSVA